MNERSFLLAAGGKTPLHLAIENNLIEMIEILIVNGADINAKDIVL